MFTSQSSMSRSLCPRFTAIAGLLVAALFGFAVAAQADHHGSSKAMLVKIHADWCGTCTKLNTTWEVLQQEHGANVRFVILDVTNQSAVEKSRAEAERLGITALFDKYKASTGTVAVVNSATGETVSVMKGEFDAAKYASAIASLLES